MPSVRISIAVSFSNAADQRQAGEVGLGLDDAVPDQLLERDRPRHSWRPPSPAASWRQGPIGMAAVYLRAEFRVARESPPPLRRRFSGADFFLSR